MRLSRADIGRVQGSSLKPGGGVHKSNVAGAVYVGATPVVTKSGLLCFISCSHCAHW